jgi:hypothetical protein
LFRAAGGPLNGGGVGGRGQRPPGNRRRRGGPLNGGGAWAAAARCAGRLAGPPEVSGWVPSLRPPWGGDEVRKRPCPLQITWIGFALYGNAAICVTALRKTTRQKIVGGPNICGQPRRHTMVARYMRGRKKKVLETTMSFRPGRTKFISAGQTQMGPLKVAGPPENGGLAGAAPPRRRE